MPGKGGGEWEEPRSLWSCQSWAQGAVHVHTHIPRGPEFSKQAAFLLWWRSALGVGLFLPAGALPWAWLCPPRHLTVDSPCSDPDTRGGGAISWRLGLAGLFLRVPT